METTHFMYVPFTGLGLHNGYRGDQWLKNRIEVFKKFVLPSLLHQSNRKYILWISWRPEEEGNHHVLDLYSTLSSLRNFPFVFTYGGVCFEDDKYDRPESLKRLQKALTINLPELQPFLGTSDRVLMTIQPSDDMYLSHVVEDIQKESDKDEVNIPRSYGYRNGYILNCSTLELAHYNIETIPPFFTILFPRSVFLDPEAHMKWTGPYRSHEYISDHTTYHEMEGEGFIVGTHGENISTTWQRVYRGEHVGEEEKERIFSQAGLVGVDPIHLVKDRTRKFEQTFVNALPVPLKRTWMRFRSPGLGSAIDDYHYFSL